MSSNLALSLPSEEAKPVELHLLGGFRLRIHGFDVPPLPKPVQLLIAQLAIAGKPGVSRDVLASSVWPDAAPDRARFYLRRALTQLRTALGSERDLLMTSTDRHLALQLPEGACDLFEFRRLSKQGDHAAAIDAYHGSFLFGLEADWVGGERLVLRQEIMTCLERLATRAEAEGDLAAALVTNRRAISEDPLCEAAWQRLLKVLAKRREYAEVSRQYKEVRRRFQRDLGLPLTKETDDLYARILGEARISLSLMPSAMPSPPARSRIPSPVTSLIGRKAECERANAGLLTSRLVSVVGVAGVGKTRVAQAVAAAHGDPVVWIDLANASGVREAILAAFEIADASQLYASIESGGTRLLVLDNAENLTAECRGILRELLESCPDLRVLYGSRNSLQIPGEFIATVGPLNVGCGSTAQVLTSDAVCLFVERATTANPAIVVTEANAQVIAEICRRLDGLPLALELAAMRARSMSLEEIARRLDDRFRLLDTSDAPVGRHGTLAKALDWSYDLLNESERNLFDRLSVFPNDWTLAAAEAVCGVERDDPSLNGLVEHSLVQFDGHDRYSLLETVRAYSERWLALRPDLQSTLELLHAEYYLNATDQDDSIVEAEEANLLTAALNCLKRREAPLATTAIRLTNRLSTYWSVAGRTSEAVRVGLRVIASVPDEVTDDLTELLIRTGSAAHSLFNLPLADELLNRAQSMADQVGLELWTIELLRARGDLASNQGRLLDAERLLQSALSRYAEFGDRKGEASCLRQLGYVARQNGDLVRSQALTEEALTIHTMLGDEFGRLWCLGSLGATSLSGGDLGQARTRFEEALALHAAAENREGISWNLAMLAEVAMKQDQPLLAIERLRASLSAIQQDEELQTRVWPLSLLGEALTRSGDLVGAQDPLDEAIRLHKLIGPSKLEVTTLLRMSELYIARGDLSTARTYHKLACSVAENIENHDLGDRLERVRAQVSV